MAAARATRWKTGPPVRSPRAEDEPPDRYSEPDVAGDSYPYFVTGAVAPVVLCTVRRYRCTSRGDEVTILFEDVTSLDDVTPFAERILEALRAPFILAGHKVFSAASIRIALNTYLQDKT